MQALRVILFTMLYTMYNYIVLDMMEATVMIRVSW